MQVPWGGAKLVAGLPPIARTWDRPEGMLHATAPIHSPQSPSTTPAACCRPTWMRADWAPRLTRPQGCPGRRQLHSRGGGPGQRVHHHAGRAGGRRDRGGRLVFTGSRAGALPAAQRGQSHRASPQPPPQPPPPNAECRVQPRPQHASSCVRHARHHRLPALPSPARPSHSLLPPQLESPAVQASIFEAMASDPEVVEILAREAGHDNLVGCPLLQAALPPLPAALPLLPAALPLLPLPAALPLHCRCCRC